MIVVFQQFSLIIKSGFVFNFFSLDSLLYDPFSEKIYDYAGGLRDLKMSKVSPVYYSVSYCYLYFFSIFHVSIYWSTLLYIFANKYDLHVLWSQLRTIIPAQLSFKEDCGEFVGQLMLRYMFNSM